ncbi:rhodanese-like domain-containing protein [Clostridium sp. Marseille-Q2269]|uniref:rhodanese-like domain-containing protein n=1 Tax=Clostridium sp. Marseille-Q2269 TaxID=2942205 RepID=UPI0020749357|nr:rhodanese-like domain-containing protein [Clostridium sp. Marseille-Q2269]
MKKKIIALLLSVVALFSFVLVGCSKYTSTSTDNKEETKQEAKKDDKKEDSKKFNYIKADELKSKIEKKEKVIILDIQVKDEFDKHHIKGAIETSAYPVKTDEDKAKLDKVMDKLTSSEEPIAIICPKGKGGAEKTYNYLKGKGIKEDRLLILEKGQSGWTYEDLLEK